LAVSDGAVPWARVKQLLADALERQGEERERFVTTSCADEPELRREVEGLLAAHDRSGLIDRLAEEWVSPLRDRAMGKLASEIEPPPRIGHYAVIEAIGSGGMGVVYSARDVRLDRPVALKFLPPHLVTDPTATRRFLQEAKTAAALDHPNICTIYDVGETPDGKFFIAMPLYEGETLDRRIARGPLPVGIAVDIALQTARGLARTHERGIVHCDLKPANLFLTADGVVKVLDFGIAKLSGAARTITGERLGTVAYMSPEQAHGIDVDHRTDIWSLGAVLYEMLTGRRAFPGGEQIAVVHAILHEAVTPLRSFQPDVREDFERAVMSMLARDPAARPASMRDVEALLSKHGGIAAARSVPLRSLLLVSGAVVALVLAAFTMWRTRDRPVPIAADPNVVAVFPFSVVGSSEVEYLREGMVSLLSTQLDGAGSLRTVDPRALLATARAANPSRLDPHNAGDVAGRLGAGTFVLGDVAEAGGRIRLHATLFEHDTARGEGEAEGPDTNLLQLVDELAAELLVAARGGTGGRPSRIAALTTTSLPALKAYLNGDVAYRAERHRDAMEWYGRAVALDTAFALGYYHLALAAQQLTAGSIAWQAIVQAMNHASRLSPRDRKLVEAFHTWFQRRHLAAADQYRALLGAHPDEVEAWLGLGVILLMTNPLYGRSVSEAREPFERAKVLDPRSPFPVRHLVYIAAAEGRVRDVDSLIARLDSLGGRGDRWYEMEGLRVAARDDPRERQSFLAALDTAQEFQLLMGTDAPAMFLRDFEGPAKSLQLLTLPTRSLEARSLGHAWLARLFATGGRWRQAMAEVDALRRIDPDAALDTHAELMTLAFAPVTTAQRDSLRSVLEKTPAPAGARPAPSAPATDAHWYYGPPRSVRPVIRIYLAGTLALLVGDIAAAERASARLSDEATKPGARNRDLYENLARALRAATLRRAGKSEQALRELEGMKDAHVGLAVGAPLASYAPARLLRAEVLERLGRIEEALPWCTTIGYVSFYEIPYLPAANLCAQRILTRLGRTEAAARHSAELLRIWRAADPELSSFVRRIP
jgi:tetratricopeptide (TPR) repeat protein